MSGDYETYTVENGGSTIRVQLNFEFTNSTGSFTIRYVAKGAAKRFTDTAQLYWQFIGADTAVQSHNVNVTVRLPEGVVHDQVRAWAHGPLWGTVAIEPDASVLMKVDPLPAYTFVEGRILFPAAALSRARRHPAPSWRRCWPRRRSSPTKPTALASGRVSRSASGRFSEWVRLWLRSSWS